MNLICTSLRIFEDDEAVIKITIKARSPTVRNVSRTHRVASDWLFDRINLDCQIQIRYIEPILKCLDLARIGGLDIPWSVNKLARTITKWTKACDKRLARLISCIHLKCEYKQDCYVGNTAQQCRLGLFRVSDFAGDLEDSKSTSERIL